MPTAGTAYFIGIVLVTMFTGQLVVQHQGRRARAAVPSVVPLRWGWQRAHRALARGQLCVEALCACALAWCLEHLPVEAVRLGRERRSVQAIDSSTMARLRAKQKKCDLVGKGDCHRARPSGFGQPRRRPHHGGARQWCAGWCDAPALVPPAKKPSLRYSQTC
ncbi:MAG: hypothetical protein ACRD9R_13590 [Pyrinomonadaceae bacterium]